MSVFARFDAISLSCRGRKCDRPALTNGVWSLCLSGLFYAYTGCIAVADNTVDYLKQVKPVLAERCYACHGALKREGGLRLDTAAFLLKGGDSGPAVVPGDADGSLLLKRISASDESLRMPAEGQPLKAEQVALVRSWIAHNDRAPADEKPEQDPRDHWSFRPVVRPVPGQSNRQAWVRNEIDAFVAEKHDQLGLTPQPAAPREVLVRRLYLDLIGVPPTEKELVEIDSAPEDEWYEPLVDRLLEDPRHGERWARHWMDIWRYSDWWGLGDVLRNSQRHIWHWRDWIVESLNANMPYDEMIRLMLAADEIAPGDLDKLRATGFLARNWSLFARNVWMEETVEHVSKAFLGLTMNCAKCHDHKYDPIAQVDFYRMRAFFEPYHVRMDMVPGEADLARDGIPRVFDGAIEAPTYRFERGQESQPDKSAPILPGVPELLTWKPFSIQPLSLPKEAYQPARRPWVLQAYISAAADRLTAAEKALAEVQAHGRTGKNTETDAELHAAQMAAGSARADLMSIERGAAAMRAAWAQADDSSSDPSLADVAQDAAAQALQAERQAAVSKAAFSVAELELKLCRAAPDGKPAVETELKAASEALSKAEHFAKTPPGAADHFAPLVGAQWTATRFESSVKDDPEVKFPDHSTGRRMALAEWIADSRNPLTARVAVNHIWARHMGAPLVPTVFDFGRKGTPPAIPRLLDWLASEFIDSGWDMKHLHRLIVTSAVYRMSSTTAGGETNQARDPENAYLWRRTPIRLEAEVVRDSILSLAGTLDLARGGPPVLPAQQADSTRRSLYFFHSNNERNPFLTTFDEASVKECYRRDQSIVPQQALALSNSRLTHDSAKSIAERLSMPASAAQAAPDDAQFIRRAFYLMLGMHASEAEVDACMEALTTWRKGANAQSRSPDRGRQNLVWALLNHNDFVTLR
jgi:hypothetical protein